MIARHALTPLPARNVPTGGLDGTNIATENLTTPKSATHQDNSATTQNHDKNHDDALSSEENDFFFSIHWGS